MSRQPSPVIDSSVPLGSDTGICWPWDITCWVAPNRAPILSLPEKQGERKKTKKTKPQYFFLWVALPEVFRESIQQTQDPNAQTRIRCGLLTESTKRLKSIILLYHFDKNRLTLIWSLKLKLNQACAYSTTWSQHFKIEWKSYPILTITNCPQPTAELLKGPLTAPSCPGRIGVGLCCWKGSSFHLHSMTPVSLLPATKPALGELVAHTKTTLLSCHCCCEIHPPHAWRLRRNVSLQEISKNKNKNKDGPIHHDHVFRLSLATAWAANKPVLALLMPAGLCGEDTPALNLYV